LNYIINNWEINRKNLSIGFWLPDVNRVKLTRTKGKFVHYIGYCEVDEQKMNEYRLDVDSDDEQQQDVPVKYLNEVLLYPEEALFLLESVRRHFNF
jgi:hypothetical protein